MISIPFLTALHLFKTVKIYIQYMIFEQNCNKYSNMKYFDEHTLIEIKNIPNNNYLKG